MPVPATPNKASINTAQRIDGPFQNYHGKRYAPTTSRSTGRLLEYKLLNFPASQQEETLLTPPRADILIVVSCSGCPLLLAITASGGNKD